MMRVLSGLIAVLALTAATLSAAATEYSLAAFFAKPEAVAAAIGSNDADLSRRLEGMTAYAEQNGLERCFKPADQWKTAIADLVAGRPRANEDINGFALEMLLVQRAERREPRHLTQPYADLDNAVLYFRARGPSELAEYLRRIASGNTGADAAGLPSALHGRLGATGFPAKISVFTPDDAGKLRSLLPEIAKAEAELSEYIAGEETAGADAARAAIEGAERERWAEHYKDTPPEGEPVEQVIDRIVAETLAEPYWYTDAVTAMTLDLEALAGWLDHAVQADKAVFFVYPSD